MKSIEQRREDNHGRYNDFPKNWMQISEEEFWERFAIWHWDMDSRQMYPEGQVGQTKMVGARLFWRGDDEGLGIVEQYDWKKQKHVKPTFFRFYLCEHEWEHSATLGRCYNRYKCKKCGATKEVDSGD